MKTQSAAVTICAKNYIAKAKVLRESYLNFHVNHDFFIVLMDRKDKEFELLHSECQFIWVEDVGIDDFYQHAFMFDIIEFSTNVKPSVLRKLLLRYEQVLYIDPDIQIFDVLSPVFNALNDSSIVITPHTLTPILDGKHPDDSDFLKFGAYNLGFIGVSQCDEAFSFLVWWSDRCLRLGFYEPQLGLAVDQKWIDLAPAYFPTLKILRDLGLNVSFWNLHERHFSKKNEKWFVNEIQPLYFVHFSSFDADFPSAIAMKQDRFVSGEREDALELYQNYANLLKLAHVDKYKSIPYSFDYFEDGMYITATMRRFYCAVRDSYIDDVNPFAKESKVRAFGERKGLVSRKYSAASRQNFKDIASFGKELKMIYFILKIILKLVGPVRYFALMRLLPNLSSIRSQRAVIGK